MMKSVKLNIYVASSLNYKFSTLRIDFLAFLIIKLAGYYELLKYFSPTSVTVTVTPFFMFSVNNSFSMKKVEIKFTTVTNVCKVSSESNES